jgi:hypothetical protein
LRGFWHRIVREGILLSNNIPPAQQIVAEAYEAHGPKKNVKAKK